jgi:hypothetical protein
MTNYALIERGEKGLSEGGRAGSSATKAKGLPEEALPLPCLEAAAQRSATPTVEAVLMRTAIRGL